MYPILGVTCALIGLLIGLALGRFQKDTYNEELQELGYVFGAVLVGGLLLADLIAVIKAL